MAKHDSKLKTTPSKDATQRFYTVGYVPNGGRGDPAPAIILKGRWLERAGFTCGTAIVVTIIDNKHLVISPLPTPPTSTMIDKIECLSSASQRKLDQMINGLVLQEQQAG